MATPRKLIKEKRGPKGKWGKVDPLKVVEEMSKMGATNAEIGRALGVNQKTIAQWVKDNPELSNVRSRNRAEADAKVEVALYKKATGYSCPAVKFMVVAGKVVTKRYIEHYPPSDIAIMFWLKNRKPAEWREKNEVGFVNPDGTGIAPITVCVTPEEMPRPKQAEQQQETKKE